MDSELLRLSEQMIAKLKKHGIESATPIQKEIIPAINEGRDVIAQSETGSGKTLSFALPIIEKIIPSDGLKALVLVPTRELCLQVANEFAKFSIRKNFAVTAVYGGVSISEQVRKLKRTNVVVATPGRLIDLLDRKALRLDNIEFLVFDEADRMLDMGFIRDIERILKEMPQKKQSMLFSATESGDTQRLSKKYLDNPHRVSFSKPVQPDFLRQTYYETNASGKIPLLIHLLKNERDLTIVFCNRKHVTDKLAKNLTAQGIAAKSLHGDVTQAKREKIVREFKDKKFKVLIATDVAARGLHIEDISHVYNYEIPQEVESYTHRVGRTARAGKKGEAISIVASEEDRRFFRQILFTHKGIITLKTVNHESIPPLQPAAKKEKLKQASGTAQDQRHRPASHKTLSDKQKASSHTERSERHKPVAHADLKEKTTPASRPAHDDLRGPASQPLQRKESRPDFRPGQKEEQQHATRSPYKERHKHESHPARKDKHQSSSFQAPKNQNRWTGKRSEQIYGGTAPDKNRRHDGRKRTGQYSGAPGTSDEKRKFSGKKTSQGRIVISNESNIQHYGDRKFSGRFRPKPRRNEDYALGDKVYRFPDEMYETKSDSRRKVSRQGGGRNPEGSGEAAYPAPGKKKGLKNFISSKLKRFGRKRK